MLVLRNIFWTLLMPGTAIGYIPYLILSPRASLLPPSWGVAQVAGLVPMAIGVSILLRCIWDFATSGRGTLSPIDPPRKLVVRGLYRYVRNPMYVGVLTVILGEALFFESWALLQFAVFAFLVFHLVVALYEEPTLRDKFGSSYDEYRAAVRRWLPGKSYDPAGQLSEISD